MNQTMTRKQVKARFKGQMFILHGQKLFPTTCAYCGQEMRPYTPLVNTQDNNDYLHEGCFRTVLKIINISTNALR